jgi:hypothetical protein
MADTPRNALRGPVGAAIDGTGLAVAGALAGLAKMRGGKAVHPHGVVYDARLTIDGGPRSASISALLGTEHDWPAIIRFSRSLGLPRPVPDLLGMSIRVLDAYGEDRPQDFLLVSSIDLPVLRHIFIPSRDAQDPLYSSSLPYRAGDRTILIAARAQPGSPRPGGSDEFDRLEAAAQTGRLRFDLMLSSLLGRFNRVGELNIGARLPPDADALRFNPFNTGPDLEPVGALNRWRRAAYPRSQRAWGGTGNRALTQDRADVIAREIASAG